LDIGFRVAEDDTDIGLDQTMLPAAAVGRAKQIQDEIKAGRFLSSARTELILELNDGNRQEITSQVTS
jgi:hypothetical protein